MWRLAMQGELPSTQQVWSVVDQNWLLSSETHQSSKKKKISKRFLLFELGHHATGYLTRSRAKGFEMMSVWMSMKSGRYTYIEFAEKMSKILNPQFLVQRIDCDKAEKPSSLPGSP